MKFKKIAFVLAYLSAMCAVTQATEMRTIVELSYKGGTFSSSPTEEELANIQKYAKTKLVEKYVASLSVAQQRNARPQLEQAASNPDSFLTSFLVEDKAVDSDAKSIRLAVRGDVNDKLFASKVGGDNQKLGRLTFVFLGQNTDSTKVHDVGRTDISIETKHKKSSLAEEDNSVSQTARSGTKTQSKGSTTYRSDTEKYSAETSDAFDAAFKQTLTEAGIRVVDYQTVVRRCKVTKSSQLNELFARKDKQYKEAIGGVADKLSESGCLKLKYFAHGNMTVSTTRTDTASGLRECSVTVYADVLAFDDGIAESIATVKPIVRRARGKDQQEARHIAIGKAAEEAATQVISILQNNR